MLIKKRIFLFYLLKESKKLKNYRDENSNINIPRYLVNFGIQKSTTVITILVYRTMTIKM